MAPREPTPERPALASSPCYAKGETMGSSRPWTVTAQSLIAASRAAGQPVWLDRAVKDILREHPDCGLNEMELAAIIRDLVIEQRWSLDGS